ncbi:MAG: riboflavin synthase [Planctomycetaceae bacterium]|nr:MAG: riboflavin synthase [Planctomycetaceae bacterium]
MFTGLVETMGRLIELIDQPPGKRLRIDAGETIGRDASIGDSVCCNGCCLTVIGVENDVLDFEAGEETLVRTNLGRLAPGDPINLERSLAADGRLGGHYVSGHVDALATLLRIEPDPPWAKLWFRVPARWAPHLAPKGSVTLDGVSLTVVDVTEADFSVALIPHTLGVTTLGIRRSGDEVNLETDILAKYIERQLEARGTWPNDKPADS